MNPRTVRAISFAQHLAKDLAAILDDDLLGVYLHGSGATNCFNPDRSDIDLLVVAQETLPPEQRRAVAELLLASSGAPYPVELTLLTPRQLRPWRHPTPFDFHYSESRRQSLTQQLAAGELSSHPLTDPDLAAHITVVRARGRVLVGAPINAVFPEVPAADFRQVILADLDWIRHHSTTIYGVLNTCRILAYLDGQGLLSKAEGANWALDNLPATYRATISKARSAYRNGSDEPCSPQEVQAFARWAAARATQAHSGDKALRRSVLGPQPKGNHGQQRARVVTRRSQGSWRRSRGHALDATPAGCCGCAGTGCRGRSGA